MTDNPRPATPEELEKIREQNKKFRAERLKKLQAEWYRQDVSGETEEAIERWKFREED